MADSIFSFRAECMHDVDMFRNACVQSGISISMQLHPDPQFPDVDVELWSSSSEDQLLRVMETVPDSHVMLETLRQCSLEDNSLERFCTHNQ